MILILILLFFFLSFIFKLILKFEYPDFKIMSKRRII